MKTYEDSRIEKDLDDLEDLLDTGTLMGLLEQLSIVCERKADHAAGNWQDEALANKWRKASLSLDRESKRHAIVNLLPS